MEEEMKKPVYQTETNENKENCFSSSELKLLNLIAELVVNISIRESYEKSNTIPTLQR